MELLILVVWFLLSFTVGYVAEQKGRSGPGWFFFAMVLSPLFAILCVMALPERNVSTIVRSDDLN